MSQISVRYIVADVASAITFYTERLGFRLDMHPAPGFAMVSRGELRLLLSRPGGPGGPGRPGRPGGPGGPGGPGCAVRSGRSGGPGCAFRSGRSSRAAAACRSGGPAARACRPASPGRSGRTARAGCSGWPPPADAPAQLALARAALAPLADDAHGARVVVDAGVDLPARRTRGHRAGRPDRGAGRGDGHRCENGSTLCASKTCRRTPHAQSPQTAVCPGTAATLGSFFEKRKIR